MQEIRGHDTSAYERAAMSAGLGDIYVVRLRIFIWKFVIKFLNNSINHLGPFCFYSIGGYFVIQGRLEIGTLMAAIAAHKDLGAPWKELLNYYQRREDARIKYEQVDHPVQSPRHARRVAPASGPRLASARVEGENRGLRPHPARRYRHEFSSRACRSTCPANAKVAVVGTSRQRGARSSPWSLPGSRTPPPARSPSVGRTGGPAARRR